MVKSPDHERVAKTVLIGDQKGHGRGGDDHPPRERQSMHTTVVVKSPDHERVAKTVLIGDQKGHGRGGDDHPPRERQSMV